MYFGLNIKNKRQHFIRATVEGILYEIYSIGKILEEHRTIDSLSINGSFGSIPFCTQVIADIFNKPVSLRQEYHSVASGTFLLSAMEMGIYKSLDEAAQTVVLPDKYTPQKENHAVYSSYMNIFERLSTKLFDEFEAIATIQQTNAAEQNINTDLAKTK